MQGLDYQMCSAAFRADGSLRDIYVPGTNLADWDRFLELASAHHCAAFVDGQQAQLPKTAAEIFGISRDAAVLLQITVGGAKVNCHFFEETEIELDIDPTEVTDQRALDDVLGFMADLGSTLGKDVILTDENAPTSVWFAYDAVRDHMQFLPR